MDRLQGKRAKSVGDLSAGSRVEITLISGHELIARDRNGTYMSSIVCTRTPSLYTSVTLVANEMLGIMYFRPISDVRYDRFSITGPMRYQTSQGTQREIPERLYTEISIVCKPSSSFFGSSLITQGMYLRTPVNRLQIFSIHRGGLFSEVCKNVAELHGWSNFT